MSLHPTTRVLGCPCPEIIQGCHDQTHYQGKDLHVQGVIYSNTRHIIKFDLKKVKQNYLSYRNLDEIIQIKFYIACTK